MIGRDTYRATYLPTAISAACAGGAVCKVFRTKTYVAVLEMRTTATGGVDCCTTIFPDDEKIDFDTSESGTLREKTPKPALFEEDEILICIGSSCFTGCGCKCVYHYGYADQEHSVKWVNVHDDEEKMCHTIHAHV